MSEPEFEGYTTTLYTLARIYDVGTQFLAQAGTRPYNGLPRTFEEYIARLYGQRWPDHFLFLNYGFLASIVVLVLALLVLPR